MVCLVGAIAWYEIHATRVFFEPARLLSRFPVENAAVFSADFTLLREAGLLSESKAAVEPDYRKFVDATGFDYKRDLDFVVASFSTSGNYYIARGRFNWPKLRAYAAQQGGGCYQDLCRMPGSTPERRISFLPLRSDAIAVAVSTYDLAASRLVNAGAPVAANLPHRAGVAVHAGRGAQRRHRLERSLGHLCRFGKYGSRGGNCSAGGKRD